MSEYELCPFCASNMIADIAGDPKRGTCLQCGAECDEWNRRDLAALQQKTIARLEAEKKRLTDKLAFYAIEWEPTYADSGLVSSFSPSESLLEDSGSIARAALEGEAAHE